MVRNFGEESHVLKRVERIVCECVNNVFSKCKDIDPSELYRGKTNAAFPVRIARGAVFSVSHDRFGLSYYGISRHVGITMRNIMRSVRTYKDIPDSDDNVNRVREMIEVKLSKFPVL